MGTGAKDTLGGKVLSNAELRKIAEAATSGVLEIDDNAPYCVNVIKEDGTEFAELYCLADAELISVARAAILRLLDDVAERDKTCDDLYYALRTADDVGIDESLFDEDERSTGPDGLYPKLEERWREQNPKEIEGARIEQLVFMPDPDATRVRESG